MSAGIPVAVTSIARLAGLSHAPIRTLPAYAAIREHAVRAGEYLGRGRRLWTALDGDFADAFARTWGGGRLALLDALGTEVAVASVMLVEYTGGPVTGWRVVVDARPDMARQGAFLRSIDLDAGGRSRPAA